MQLRCLFWEQKLFTMAHQAKASPDDGQKI